VHQKIPLYCRIKRTNRYGTGSYPGRLQGWQRANLFSPSHTPFMAPYFSTASYMYIEHVGSNLHLVPSIGEMFAL